VHGFSEGGGQPGEPARVAYVVAPCEKNSFRDSEKTSGEERICALGDCFETVEGPTRKRFCSVRCQRIDEKRRYRERHRETATCKRNGCGVVFERDPMAGRKQVFCSLACQALSRSVEYKARPDIQANVARATLARRGGGVGEADRNHRIPPNGSPRENRKTFWKSGTPGLVTGQLVTPHDELLGRPACDCGLGDAGLRSWADRREGRPGQ
jgi:hypothetical protein